jgi:hypothetical protein
MNSFIGQSLIRASVKVMLIDLEEVAFPCQLVTWQVQLSVFFHH